MNLQTLIVIFLAIIILVVMLNQPVNEKSQKISETYEPRQMGGRRYWGFGRKYGTPLQDHRENHGFCYPSSLRNHTRCLPGYQLYLNNFTGRRECCVNRSNY